MKAETHYYGSASRDVVLLPGKIYGPLGDQNVHFVFDPGAHRTIIAVALTDYLGYQANFSSKKTSTTSIVGKEFGYTVVIKQLNVLGFEFKNVEIAVFDLPEKYGIDGLIGLDLLERFEVTLRHRDRMIRFDDLDE